MWEIIAVILLVCSVALVVWRRPCPPTRCEYEKTPQLARPSIHHVPFRYPRDTNNSDQMNYMTHA